MNYRDYTEGTRATYGDDPTENTQEAIKCCFCHNDLDAEEITENEDEKNKYCNDCFYSCCGDELNQDVRICPTCKEHN
tara:strand:- start:424 stop:657 length:234 start_codon:yes stop_codon:yes gene_type:complete